MKKEEQQIQDERPDLIDERGEVQEAFAEGPDEPAEVANDEEEQAVS